MKLLVLAEILLASPVLAAPYSVLSIGPSDGTAPEPIDPTSGLYLNNLGEVAGTFHGSINGGNTGDHGFRTQPNSPLSPVADDIGQFQQPPPSDIHPTFSAVSGLNNLGQVLGVGNDTLGLEPFLTDTSGKINSSTVKLGNVSAAFVNDQDQIAGSASFNGSNVYYRTQPGQPRYNSTTDNQSATDNIQLVGLNNQGQLAGYDLSTLRSFITEPQGQIPNGGNMGQLYAAHALNELGQTGGAVQVGDNGSDPFVTSPNQGYPNGTDLGNLGGRFSAIRDLSNSGVSVGFSDLSDGNGHAFVSFGLGINDLNGLIDPSLGLTLTDALQINDNGQILALAQDQGGNGSVLLLTPVPEPTCFALLGLSSFLLVRRRRA